MKTKDSPPVPQAVTPVRMRTRKPSQSPTGKQEATSDKGKKRKSRAGKARTIPTRTNTQGVEVEATGAPDKRENPAIVEPLIQYIEAGNTYRNAVCLTGISEECFHRWMREGKEAPEGTVARRFYERCREASAKAEHRNLMVIQKGRSNWGASSWFLARRNPEEWGRKDSIKLSGDANNPLIPPAPVDGNLSANVLAALSAVLKRNPDLVKV